MNDNDSVRYHYVYILECSDGTYYTGYTTDLNRRLDEHNKGVGAKYTRGRIPCTMVYTNRYNSRSDALREEYRIKQLSRSGKIALMKGNTNLITDYSNVKGLESSSNIT